jgi:hypothetical protein
MYGIDNVRGGSFCSVFLSLDVKIMIERMIRGSTDKCFKCGESGHFSSNCNNKERSKPYDRLPEKIKKRISKFKSNRNSDIPTHSQIPIETSEINNPSVSLSVSMPLPVPELINVFNLPVPELINVFNLPVPELINVFNLPVPELIKVF